MPLDGCATDAELMTFPPEQMKVPMTVLDLQRNSCAIATDHGFWETYNRVRDAIDMAADGMECGIDPTLGTVIIDSKLMLIVGEVAEAEDALRHNKSLPEFASELADIMIRTADLAHQLGINLEVAILAKQQYNISRPYKHGKVF